MKKAYGFIEMVGLASAVVAVDTALKAANVELDGLESAKGAGMHTLKISGEVSSVKAAVSSILGERSLQGKVYAHTVIARLSDGLEGMIEGSKDDLVRKNTKEAEKESMAVMGRDKEVSDHEEAEASVLPEGESQDDEESQDEDEEVSEASPKLPQRDADAAVEAEKETIEMKTTEEAEETEVSPKEPGPESPDGVDAPMEEAPEPSEDEEKKKIYTCNICLDPKCIRIKGEPRTKCIHYKEKE